MKKLTGIFLITILTFICVFGTAACKKDPEGPVAPSAPLNLTAVAGDEQVTLSWDAPASSGSSAIFRYSVVCGNSSAGKDKNERTHTFTGLTNGVEYEFKVSAINDDYEMGAAATIKETPVTSKTQPSVPLNLKATEQADGKSIKVEWEAPGDNGGGEIVKYEVSSGGEWVQSDFALAHTFGGLTDGTEYTFKVRAFNVDFGSTEASITKRLSTVPGAVKDFAVIISGSSAQLSWEIPENTGGLAIESYEVQMGDDGWIPVEEGTQHTFYGIEMFVPYTFNVRAVNAKGVGPESTKNISVGMTLEEFFNQIHNNTGNFSVSVEHEVSGEDLEAVGTVQYEVNGSISYFETEVTVSGAAFNYYEYREITGGDSKTYYSHDGDGWSLDEGRGPVNVFLSGTGFGNLSEGLFDKTGDTYTLKSPVVIDSDGDYEEISNCIIVIGANGVTVTLISTAEIDGETAVAVSEMSFTFGNSGLKGIPSEVIESAALKQLE